MTLRRCIKGLVFSAASLVAAAGATGQTGRFDMYWGAFGPQEPLVETSRVPQIKRDGVKVLYAGQAGQYPKVWQGQLVNGGVPVAADMNVHLTRLRLCLEWYIPQNFTGHVVIDYEDWDALWVHTPEEYRELTRNVVRAQYAGLTPAQVEEYSIRDHEAAAKNFMLQTLNECKALRPNAKWGYYGYPRDHHTGANEAKLQWLWDAQTAFFPVAYTVYPVSSVSPAPWAWAPEEFYPDYMQNLVGMCRRQAGTTRPVVAFAWCRYHSMNPTFGDQFMNETDLRRMLRVPRLKGADGVVFWEYVDGQQEVNDYNNYFTTLLARVAAEVDLEFNPPSSGQSGGSGGSGNNPPAPPIPLPPPPPNGGSGTANAAPPSNGNSGSTGTYTNTAIPGTPWTNPDATASNGETGEPAANPDPNAQAPSPADPNAPATGNADPNQPPVKAVKKAKAKKGVSTRTNSRFASGATGKKRVLMRDLDRIAALKMMEERKRRAAERNGTALADAPTGD